MVFLDFVAFKGPRWKETGFLDTKLYVKEGNPLAYIPINSCHPPWCWKGWVKAEILRRLILDSSEQQFHDDVTVFLKRLIQRGYGGKALRKVASTVSFADRAVFLRSKDRASQKEGQLYFVNIYHPQFKKFSSMDEPNGFGLPVVQHAWSINTSLMRKLWKFH